MVIPTSFRIDRSSAGFFTQRRKEDAKAQRSIRLSAFASSLRLCVKLLMWSISIYRGNSPFRLEPSRTPALSKDHITDIPAEFVADPFMLQHNRRWHMFFESITAKTKPGKLALATSNDGLTWSYQQVVLREPFHLSYPHVFKFHDT